MSARRDAIAAAASAAQPSPETAPKRPPLRETRGVRVICWVCKDTEVDNCNQLCAPCRELGSRSRLERFTRGLK